MNDFRFNELEVKKPKTAIKKCMGSEPRFQYLKPQRVGPGSYSQWTIFDMCKFKNQGVHFRESRTAQKQSTTPGVGGYTLNDPLDIKIKYTVPKGTRTTSAKPQHQLAPNAYDQTIKEQNTKYKNYGNTVILPTSVVQANKHKGFVSQQEQIINMRRQFKNN